jgi:4-hydroxy-3-methylbut-2-enyl diphosphate reductase
MVDEQDRRQVPVTDQVLITAHGISQRERSRLESAGKSLLDTTCPLVERAHQAAQKLQQAGYHILVIGRRGHVEVQGIIEDLENCNVVQGPEEVQTYPHPRLGIMCQTTTPERLVEQVRAAVVRQNPEAEIRFVDTVCHPTKDHQKALEQLLDQVEAVVVVGGRNSNNTRQLVTRCHERHVPAYHVQNAAELQPDWFDNLQSVGLTAGTSTLEATIDDVYHALLEIGRRQAHTPAALSEANSPAAMPASFV